MIDECSYARDDEPVRSPSIRVVVNDLAFVPADAVLRPADEFLGPATAATARLDQLAGEAFTAQRRVGSPLEAGAAVVTSGGDLAAPLVIHLVIRDGRSAFQPDIVRRALVSAWQRAADWGLAKLATSLVGAGAGQLGVEEAATLLAETFAAAREPGGGSELCIVLERDSDSDVVEAIVRRFA